MSSSSDFIIDNGVLKKYKGPGGDVVIPEGVTTIGSEAFSGCARVRELTIPGTVQSIESKAFLGCTGLAKLTIPEGVRTIGREAFRGCKSLTTLTLPSSLQKIEREAFYLCSSLTEVVIHDLAAWCRIDFESCIKDSSNPLSLAGKLCLDGELITDLVIPEGVTRIERAVFCGCTCLKSVTIPASLTSIGDAAFKRCGNLAPGAQRLVWRDELYGCGHLKTVFVRDLKAWLGIRFGNGNSNPLINGCELFIDGELVTELEIPADVTEIPFRAFIGCSSLTSVTIPEGVTSIGEEAFRGCSGLKNVTIPKSVRSIGSSAFDGCSGLKNVTIPESVTSIGGYAFSGCSGLKSVTIPESVTSIDSGAFEGCKALTSVTIPGSVKSIEYRAFYDCEKLTCLTIPDSVESIGDGAFRGCSSLTSITIPDSVTSIGEDPFAENTRVHISDIERIPPTQRLNAVLGFAEAGGGKETPGFAGCSKYIKANADKLVETAMAEPALLSLMCREKLITPKYAEIYAEAARQSKDAEKISLMLDYQANKLSAKKKESLEKRREKEQDTITDRMMARSGKEGIRGLVFTVSGNLETFDNREKLKAFLLEKGAKLAPSPTAKVDFLIINNPQSDTAKAKRAQELGIEIIDERRFNERAGRIFDMDGTKLRRYCGTETEVVVPEGVTSIGSAAFFRCKNLTSVTIPKSVSSIGGSAFYGCSSLTSVTIPESVTSIGSEAFWGCSSLTSVTIPESVTSIGDEAFEWCSGLTSVTIPKSVTSIGGSAFYGCSSLKEIRIADLGAWCNITFAEASASPLRDGAVLVLEGKRLEQADIPDGVTEIRNWAFANCKSIKSVIIPPSVRKIGLEAFSNCCSLKSVTNADRVKEIGPRAFSGCPALADENGLVIVKDVLYNYCGSGGEVRIPEGVKRIENRAFCGCKDVTGVTLPASLREMGNEAFYRSGLMRITIPEGVREIGIQAFDWCLVMC